MAPACNAAALLGYSLADVTCITDLQGFKRHSSNLSPDRSLCGRHLAGLARSQEDFMEYFFLDHPPDRLILCHRSNCEDIADYLEVNEHGREDFACAAHTSSVKHAVLPKGAPSTDPHRIRPAA